MKFLMQSFTRLWVIALGIGSLAIGHNTFAAEKIRPNIVFILADDLGYSDLSCYSAPDIRTPNIDRLAQQGVRFTDFYANGCVCTPTRCALMTGRYQQHIGGLETAIPPGAKHLGLPAQEKTIADILREAGYSTALSGKWHLGYKPGTMPTDHGFDHFFGLLSGNHNYHTHKENNGEPDLYLDGKPVEMEGYSTHLITEYALKFLSEMSMGASLPPTASGKGKDTAEKYQPFFLYVAFNAPHYPYQLPADKNHELAKSAFMKGSRETYIGMVEEMDKGIGKILNAIDQATFATNTLIVFASDNGGTTYSRNDPLAKSKGSLWEGGIRVPCLARFPDKIHSGSVTDQVGITMDWTATIAKLAGAKAPKKRAFEGIDLMPILSGSAKNAKRTLFWRNVDFDFDKKFRAVRDGNWKYIESCKNTDKFLYDLSTDIGEKENLLDQQIKRTQSPEKIHELELLSISLKAKLDTWEKSIDPPLYSVKPHP